MGRLEEEILQWMIYCNSWTVHASCDVGVQHYFDQEVEIFPQEAPPPSTNPATHA